LILFHLAWTELPTLLQVLLANELVSLTIAAVISCESYEFIPQLLGKITDIEIHFVSPERFSTCFFEWCVSFQLLGCVSTY